jgi:hypothetical protein
MTKEINGELFPNRLSFRYKKIKIVYITLQKESITMIIIICAAIALVTVALVQSAWENQSQPESIAIPVRVSENIYPPSRISRR